VEEVVKKLEKKDEKEGGQETHRLQNVTQYVHPRLCSTLIPAAPFAQMMSWS